MFTLGLEAFDVSHYDHCDLTLCPLTPFSELVVDATKRQIQDKLKQIKSKLEEPPVVDLREKISFFLGVNNLCITIYTVFARPQLVPFAFAFGSIVLLPLRFWLYYKRAWHYFTFDLCYFVNLLVLVWLFLWPSGPKQLIPACWMLSNGPVVWAVVQWKNSLVFHSLDKTTSCMIHMAPSLVMYSIRWGMDNDQRSKYHPGFNIDSIMTAHSFLGCLCYYLCWQILYYFLIDWRQAEKIHTGKRLTSYSFILKEAASKRNWIWTTLNLFGQRGRLFMFMSLQFTYAVVTMVPTGLLWQYQWAHLAVLLFAFNTCLWNGAVFYVDIFRQSYVNSFNAIHREVAEAYSLEDSKQE